MFSGLYAKLIAGGVALVLIISAWMYVTHLQAKNVALTAQVAVLNSKIKEQNDAVDKLKSDADARVKTAEILMKEAQDKAIVNKKSAQIIYRTAPSTPGKDCVADRKSALDLVNGVSK